jgi:hypothetical protein
VEARPNLEEARLFVDNKDRTLGDGATEPRLSEGDADGKVYCEVGFLGAGVADEEVEAGLGEEVLNAPLGRGRLVERIFGSVEDAVGLCAIFGPGLVFGIDV